MKKHIFGVALFSLIVASFAFVYAFFSAPSIPSKEAVKPPLARNEPPVVNRSYCNLKRDKFSHEVLGSQLYIRDGKLVSKLKLRWNGYTEAPKSIYVKARIFDINKPDSVSYIVSENFSNVFFNRNEATLTFSNVFADSSELNKKSNFYVVFDVSNQFSKEDSLFDKSRLSEASPVLTIGNR